MATNVIAVFDIGKTNKKILLFDEQFRVLEVQEQKFEEICDEDGYSCDNISLIESWMFDTISQICLSGKYRVRALNFSCYGASLAYLDDKGKRITPIYNYLNPMPADVLDGFYDRYGGVDEFSRQTASPALGMLNSGLQILWLRSRKADSYAQSRTVLHFPQYLSYLFTGQKVSEYTSIGCHTALWDFDHQAYHPWLTDEKIALPQPISNATAFDVQIGGQKLKVGIGIHDSSASLVPYFKSSDKQFILISTGTWCIFMNPFNNEPLTAEQLQKDSLCYLSIQQKQVKSSRLFMGHIHEVNAIRLAEHFHLEADAYKRVKLDLDLLPDFSEGIDSKRCFFRSGVHSSYIDPVVDLSLFSTYEQAYHQLVFDLCALSLESLQLIIPQNDQTKLVYVSGGFSRNEIYIHLLKAFLPTKEVLTSEIDNASALGAAMVLSDAFLEDGLDVQASEPFLLKSSNTF